MAMSLAAAAGGGTDSGVETGNESNDVDVAITGGLHGFDSLENDGIHIAVPPPPPTSPESANEGHGGDHEESETEMTSVNRDHMIDFNDSDGGGNSNSCFNDEDMDRDIEEDELRDAKRSRNIEFADASGIAEDGDAHCMNGLKCHRQPEFSFHSFDSSGNTSTFAVPLMFSPPPAPPATPTNLNTNTCKALMKFEFPELPKLTCQFAEPPAGFQSFVALEQFKAKHTKGYSVVASVPLECDQLVDTSCTALIPYEERDFRRKMYRNASYERRRARASCGAPGLSHHQERRLRTAASAKNIPVLSKILESGVDPNAADEMGRTALHIAACKGYSEVVRMLLQGGANPNKKDSVGNTPLHLAACTNHFDVVTCLLRAGTDVSTLDNHGRNPLQLAQSKLKLIATSKQPISEDALKIKMEVQQIIEMMLEYLQKKGQDMEAELLNAFASRLTLSQTPAEVDADVKNLLANLSSLTLTPCTSNATLVSPMHVGFRTAYSRENAGTSSAVGRACLQAPRLLVRPSTSTHYVSLFGDDSNRKNAASSSSFLNNDINFNQDDNAAIDHRMTDCKLFK